MIGCISPRSDLLSDWHLTLVIRAFQVQIVLALFVTGILQAETAVVLSWFVSGTRALLWMLRNNINAQSGSLCPNA